MGKIFVSTDETYPETQVSHADWVFWINLDYFVDICVHIYIDWYIEAVHYSKKPN